MNNHQRRQCEVSSRCARTLRAEEGVLKNGEENMLPHVKNTEKGLRSSEAEEDMGLLSSETFFSMLLYVFVVSLAMGSISKQGDGVG